MRRTLNPRSSICAAMPWLCSLAAFATITIGVMLAGRTAHADDPRAIAASMTDRSFALLKSLNSQSGGGNSNPMLGPVAAFASDAETLSHALSRADSSSVASELTALHSDEATVDAALASHPEAMRPDAWREIKRQLGAISKGLPSRPVSASARPPSSTAASATAPTTASAGALSSSSTGTLSASSSASSDRSAPRIIIDSRDAIGDSVRVRGYIEGNALKSAGVYQEGRRLKAFKVNDVPGEQKLSFDIRLEHPSPDTVIRVADVDGRFAEAPVQDLTSGGAAPSTPETLTPMTAANDFGRSSEVGVEVSRGAGVAGGSKSNTAEIPTHGAPVPSPSKRHALGGKLGNVQINILGIEQTQTMPPTYRVIGQISGQGVTRAGIYADGRLVKRIPIEDGANYTSFDQQFELHGGSATIRAYGVGDQFIESSIDAANGETAALTPMLPGGTTSAIGPPSSGLAIQITSVQPIAGNLYQVSGAISGSGLVSAGLYQNGVLAQSLNLGGGIGAILGALVPGALRSAAFSARFNPAMGPATIRAYNSAGAYSEQPILVAGVNPYGYGASPYAGVNPYATNPYGSPVSPYYAAPPVSPYYSPTRPPRPASRPLW